MPRIRIKDLAAELTLDAGTVVIIDGPVSNEIQELLSNGGAELVETPVDDEATTDETQS